MGVGCATGSSDVRCFYEAASVASQHEAGCPAVATAHTGVLLYGTGSSATSMRLLQAVSVDADSASSVMCTLQRAAGSSLSQQTAAGVLRMLAVHSNSCCS